MLTRTSSIPHSQLQFSSSSPANEALSVTNTPTLVDHSSRRISRRERGKFFTRDLQLNTPTVRYVNTGTCNEKFLVVSLGEWKMYGVVFECTARHGRAAATSGVWRRRDGGTGKGKNGPRVGIIRMKFSSARPVSKCRTNVHV